MHDACNWDIKVDWRVDASTFVLHHHLFVLVLVKDSHSAITKLLCVAPTLVVIDQKQITE